MNDWKLYVACAFFVLGIVTFTIGVVSFVKALKEEMEER